jgi:catechol 2,3-dioxygenase-like lactoylglutathione lyase family enzyme
VPARFNHTIVHATDPRRSAEFLAHIFDLPSPAPFGRFLAVQLANGVSLDFAADEPPISRQHYAFHVDEAEFDAMFERIRAAGQFWADPGLTAPGEINRWNGGRGVYFKDPDGHLLEILTRPPEL